MTDSRSIEPMQSTHEALVPTLSARCLADGIPFTGAAGWYWWLRGVRRNPVNPNLCNR